MNSESDEQLLARVKNDPFTELTMFVGTHRISYKNVFTKHVEFIKHMFKVFPDKKLPDSPIKVINTNFGCLCQPGWEFKMKNEVQVAKPKKKIDGLKTVVSKTRKLEGTGRCLNSAIEIFIVFDDKQFIEKYPNIKEKIDDHYLKMKTKFKKKVLTNNEFKKFYFVNCGLTDNNSTQITGCIVKDLADGKLVAKVWCEFMNKYVPRIDDSLPISYDPNGLPPSLFNTKYCLKISNPRLIVDIDSIAKHLEQIKISSQINLVTEEKDVLDLGFTILSIKHINDSQNISFKILYGEKKATIKMWFSGKCNILGSSPDAANIIYKYLTNYIKSNIDDLIVLKPVARRRARKSCTKSKSQNTM